MYFMNKFKQHHPILMIAFVNLAMIIGVWREHWSAFLIIYGFWLETFIISFFSSIKILFASGEHQKPPHIWLAIKYLLFRIAVLGFYLLFIVVFIGFMNTPKETLPIIMQSVSFKDNMFNTVIIGFVLSCVLDVLFKYWLNGLQMTKPPTYFFSFIDARTLIIHVVVVLGTFVFILAEKHFPENKTYMGTAGFLTLFILIKTIGDITTYKLNSATSEVDSKFI